MNHNPIDAPFILQCIIQLGQLALVTQPHQSRNLIPRVARTITMRAPHRNDIHMCTAHIQSPIPFPGSRQSSWQSWAQYRSVFGPPCLQPRTAPRTPANTQTSYKKTWTRVTTVGPCNEQQERNRKTHTRRDLSVVSFQGVHRFEVCTGAMHVPIRSLQFAQVCKNLWGCTHNTTRRHHTG